MSPSDVRDKNNKTPLHLSCGVHFSFSVNLDMVRYMVEGAHCDISEFLLQYNYLTQLNLLK